MTEKIRTQRWPHMLFFAFFGLLTLFLLTYYLSDTIVHFTTGQQFPTNSLERFPLTWLILPAEIFSFLFALYFVYCLYIDRYAVPDPDPLPDKEDAAVAILLPVYHEPAEIIERTLTHVNELRWPGPVHAYLLDDSTEQSYKDAVDRLARKHGARVVRRDDRDGYKAGNINNALREAISEPYFVILDADQAPEPEFLEHTMDHFSDPDVAYVQTPQHFINEQTVLERAIKTGSNIFYQAQCKAKARDGALPFCGTNLVVKTDAFTEIGGFSYYTATEDLEVGLRLNERGLRGAYVAEVLVNGYTPPDFTAYRSQQYRWANGNLAVLRESLPKILGGRFTLRQQVHTLFTLGWWLIGIVSFIYVAVPLLSLWFGWGTHHTWLPTALLAVLFLLVAMGIALIYASLHGRLQSEKVTLWDAFLQYSLLTNSMFIYMRAALNVLFKRYIGFVTTKKTRSRSGLRHVWPNLLLGAACLGSAVYALYMGLGLADTQAYRTYLPISLWLLFYAFVLGSSVLFVGQAPRPTGVSAA